MSQIETLLSLPSGQALLVKLQTEARTEADAQRRELSAQLNAIEIRAQREGDEIGPKIVNAESRAAKAKAELDAANNGLAALIRIRSQQSQTADRERQAIYRQFEQTAPPEIGVLINEIDEAIAKAGRQPIIVDERETEKEHRFGGKVRALFSNRPAVERKIDRLIRARKTAHGLLSRYVADLPAELKAIRAELPADEFPLAVVAELD